MYSELKAGNLSPVKGGGEGGNEGRKTNTHRDINIHFETLLLLLKHIKGQILIKEKQLLKSGQKTQFDAKTTLNQVKLTNYN